MSRSIEALEARRALEESIASSIKQDQQDTLIDPLSKIPTPIELGVSAYRPPAIFSADWRKRLPLDHSARPKNPADFIEHDDPTYRAILELMVSSWSAPRRKH
ncbi:MAG: hypothetical protein WA843_00980 [Candidatus Saccharimonadales bacterium]